VSTLRLPEGAVLLHIGLFKTGTTSLQGALFRARPELADHGVLHAGQGRNPVQAVLALRGVQPLVGYARPRAERWEELTAEVAAAPDMRVVVSSEFFSDADVETARRAVRELGGSRVHIVVTLRPLAKILPSQWQQYVRNQARFSYDSWLDSMLRKAPYRSPTPTFWRRHHHDVLVERWASIVGADKVTVIVLDETDRAALLRTFEELVGLPAGLLVDEPDTENRSLTLGEIELVRQVNIEFRRNGWPDELYKQLVRQGLVARLLTSRVPGLDEPRISTPQWALDRAAEIGAVAADNLGALGVRIVGDIATLGARVIADDPPSGGDADPTLPVAAAREAVLGPIISSGLLTRSAAVESTSAVELQRVILRRVWRRVRGKAGRSDVGG
jgi:hypothetical protein